MLSYHRTELAPGGSSFVAAPAAPGLEGSLRTAAGALSDAQRLGAGPGCFKRGTKTMGKPWEN